jgi:hypothetical protein
MCSSTGLRRFAFNAIPERFGFPYNSLRIGLVATMARTVFSGPPSTQGKRSLTASAIRSGALRGAVEVERGNMSEFIT